MESIKLLQTNNKDKVEKHSIENFTEDVLKGVIHFHESFDMYEPTPLAKLDNTAKEFGVKSFYVKDESYRFGLNAFKVLGGSYAIGKYIANQLGKNIAEMTYQDLISDEVKEQLGDITFVTATDGNHGRGVAWTANQLKQKSVVYMPRGSSPERLENIRREGSDASIVDMNYDDAVRQANADAQEKGYVVVQDTAWDGYEEIPLWIMQGYTTMAYEAVRELEDKGLERPTHLFLQAGVGSMAAAVAAFILNYYKDNPPIVTIVEPRIADPLYRTALANDGKIHNVGGDLHTIMAGLACGEPCTIAWDILEDHVDFFISAEDYVAAKGMRILASPLKGDDNLVAGESGAGPFGCIAEILHKEKYADMKEKLQLNDDSVCLFFSTEGDTDRESYLDIVWDGKYPSYEE